MQVVENVRDSIRRQRPLGVQLTSNVVFGEMRAFVSAFLPDRVPL